MSSSDLSKILMSLFPLYAYVVSCPIYTKNLELHLIIMYPTQAESAWDVPYLNRKKILFNFKIFKSYFFLPLTLLSDFYLIVKSDKEIGKVNDKKIGKFWSRKKVLADGLDHGTQSSTKLFLIKLPMYCCTAAQSGDFFILFKLKSDITFIDLISIKSINITV